MLDKFLLKEHSLCYIITKRGGGGVQVLFTSSYFEIHLSIFCFKVPVSRKSITQLFFSKKATTFFKNVKNQQFGKSFIRYFNINFFPTQETKLPHNFWTNSGNSSTPSLANSAVLVLLSRLYPDLSRSYQGIGSACTKLFYLCSCSLHIFEKFFHSFQTFLCSN